MGRALFNWEPGWSRTGEDKKKGKEEKKNGKARQRPSKVHFSPFELTSLIIHWKDGKINH